MQFLMFILINFISCLMFEMFKIFMVWMLGWPDNLLMMLIRHWIRFLILCAPVKTKNLNPYCRLQMMLRLVLNVLITSLCLMQHYKTAPECIILFRLFLTRQKHEWYHCNNSVIFQRRYEFSIVIVFFTPTTPCLDYYVYPFFIYRFRHHDTINKNHDFIFEKSSFSLLANVF